LQGDTGILAFLVESLNVSRAGANATLDYVGSKLMRKPGSDSLFCVYCDVEGNIIYSASSFGDSWQRSSVVSGHDRPAICQDASGKRWVVSYNRKDRRIEARCRLTGVRAGLSPRLSTPCLRAAPFPAPSLWPVPAVGQVALLPAPIVLSRFERSGDSYVIVAKFNSNLVGLDTVASGSQQLQVTAPTLAVEKAEGGGQQSGGATELIQLRLYSCALNPFTRTTSIRFRFGQAGNVHLRAYDVSGRLVTTLKQGHEKPGVYIATWKGTDENGRQVPNGIYFYRLDAPGISEIRKAVVMR